MEVVLIIVHPDLKNANVDRERRFSQQKHFREKKLDSNGTFRFRVPTKGPEKNHYPIQVHDLASVTHRRGGTSPGLEAWPGFLPTLQALKLTSSPFLK